MGAPDEPSEPEKPKRLSFREANLGSRDPPQLLEKPKGFLANRKRTVTISLLAVGASAAALYALAHRQPDCDQVPLEQRAACEQSIGGSSGHGGSGSGYHSSSSSSSSNSGSVAHGGFGSTGSAHGGGGE